MDPKLQFRNAPPRDPVRSLLHLAFVALGMKLFSGVSNRADPNGTYFLFAARSDLQPAPRGRQELSP